MKKILLLALKIILGLVVVGFLAFYIRWKWIIYQNHSHLGERALILTHNGQSYRDLNKNGQLDTYEDKTAAIEARVEDLTSQMTLAEKAGLLFITMTLMNSNGTPLEMPVFSEPFSFFLETNSTLIAAKHMNHVNILQSPGAEEIANWNNEIQVMAERTRLGIPVTVASDPRHGVTDIKGPNVHTPFLSRWCSPLGFAAIGDTVLMREFGEVANTEYRALGIRLALSPMADLSTEPRWSRIIGTFGEDAQLSAQLTKAYIQGFQGDSLSSESVACMVKHFSGGGPQKDGEDPHFPYGKDQIYPAGQFDYHIIPFEEGAFPAKVAQVMPYYGVPVGQTNEDVGFAYNKDIITGLLRNKYNFDGVVCTDWGLITENSVKPPAAFGVEHLSEKERILKIFDAGCDMFGGESCPELVIELVQEGKLAEARIDQSVKRVLRDKFRLGLFDDPFVRLGDIWQVGHYDLQQKGLASQRRSLTLLKNENDLLPLPKKELKVYVEGFPTDPFWTYATVVNQPEEADVIIQALSTPFEARDEYLLEQFFHQGRLDFTPEELAPILALSETKPTINVIFLERPAIIPEITAASAGLIAHYDSSPAVIAEMIFGEFSPEGKLPFEMPSSVAAVEAQAEDAPYDSVDPLFPFGFGLTYSPADSLSVN